MQTFDDLFKAFESPSQIAAALGIPDSHARTMKARGSVPVEHWDAIIKGASARGIPGVSWASLQTMRKERARQRSAA